ncbi:MAG: carbohydrate-binding protein, partial [Bacteroidia bacterium]|nr:carbohydrate-binding protein [Bacteroidia bacterium]
NAVDFGGKKIKSVQVKAMSQTGGTLQVRLDKADGTLLTEVNVPKGTAWNTVSARMLKYQKGIHNLIVVLKDKNPVEIDWIQFVN